jgi:hypothetical protein
MEGQLSRALPHKRTMRVRHGLDYHKRQATHFRALAASATTQQIRELLLHEAEQHERVIRGETAH